MIAMGTSCSYAGPDFSEPAYMRGEPIESLYSYAMTKRMLHAGLLALHKQFGLKYLSVVPATLYGPGYHTDGRQRHFIFDLMRKIIRGKELGETVTLWGDGHQRREVILVADFVEAFCQLAPVCNNELVNIASGEDHTIREFAGMICEIIGYPAQKIQYDPQGFVGARSKRLNVDKLHRLLPDFKTTPLEAGLRRTIDWFLKGKAFI